MKKTALLLITILSFSISLTLTSCEAEAWDPACYDCDNTGNNGSGNNGNTPAVVVDLISFPPVNEEILTDHMYSIQNGQLYVIFNNWINAVSGNYIHVILIPTYQADGLPRLNASGEQYYTVVSYEKRHQ